MSNIASQRHALLIPERGAIAQNPEEESFSPSTPRGFRALLRNMIEESGLSAKDISELGGPDASWTYDLKKTPEDSKKLSDRGAAVLLALSLAWSREPKSPLGQAQWAVKTLEELQMLVTWHRAASPESARHVRRPMENEAHAPIEETPDWARA
jgi:hypothetical protein